MKLNAELSENVAVDVTNCAQLAASAQTLQAIEEELSKNGIAAGIISTYLKEIKRMRNAKRNFKGFIWMGAGAFIGFLSCVLTVTQAIPLFHDFILYGLTGIGVVMVFIGLYLVFE